MKNLKDRYAALKKAQGPRPDKILAVAVREKDSLVQKAQKLLALAKRAQDPGIDQRTRDKIFLEVERLKSRILSTVDMIEKISNDTRDQDLKFNLNKINDKLNTLYEALHGAETQSPIQILTGARDELVDAPIDKTLKRLVLQLFSKIARSKDADPDMVDHAAQVFSSALKGKVVEARNALERIYAIQAIIAFGAVFKMNSAKALQTMGILDGLKKISPERLPGQFEGTQVYVLPMKDLIILNPRENSVIYYDRTTNNTLGIFSPQNQFKFVDKSAG